MERLESALKALGATLLRQKKHRVYELPNGSKYTVASTPSDRRAEDNALTELYHAAGIERPKRAKSTKPKTEKPGRIEPEWDGLSVADASRPVKQLTEKQALWQRIAELEARLKTAENRVESWRLEKAAAVKERDRAVADLCRAVNERNQYREEAGQAKSSRWYRVGAFLRVVR